MSSLNRVVVSLPVALTLLASAPAAAAAQDEPRKSQFGRVVQDVARSRIEVTYWRPVARGRALFGTLVPWGEMWTPSADSAARIIIAGDIEVEGQPLPSGRYSLWAIPDSTSWTLIFNERSSVHHLRYPGRDDALRLTVTAVAGEHVETLQFAFPMVDADSARLELRWGTTVIPLRIRSRAR